MITDSAISLQNGTCTDGIYLENNLKWNLHIGSLCRKLNSSHYYINSKRTLLPFKSLKSLYYVLVYSLLYNISLWGNFGNVGRAFIVRKR